MDVKSEDFGSFLTAATKSPKPRYKAPTNVLQLSPMVSHLESENFRNLHTCMMTPVTRSNKSSSPHSVHVDQKLPALEAETQLN